MSENNSEKNIKQSYTVSCSSAFRDAVTALALRRGVNVGDLARSVLLVVPADVVENYDDPGEPDAEDRETIILKSGPSEGRPWRRKPRLQVRMAPGFDVLSIRKALNLALSMESGSAIVRISSPQALERAEQETKMLKAEIAKREQMLAERPAAQNLPETLEELDRLRAIVSVLCFDPLPNGVRDRAEALHILGFPPNTHPSRSDVRSRFRMMATIHHPDSQYGNHQRMSQLNAAMEMLR